MRAVFVQLTEKKSRKINTMGALENGHPRDMKKLSITGAGCLIIIIIIIFIEGAQLAKAVFSGALIKRIGSLYVVKSGDRARAGMGLGGPGPLCPPLFEK